MAIPSPSISVLLPVHNGGPYLEKAVKSVLDQTFMDFELLILDDASTDESGNVISKFRDDRIRVFQQSSRIGIARTLNNGIEKARGSWIARMDADDVSHPDRFRKMMALIEERVDADLIGTSGMVIDQLGKRLGRALVCTRPEENRIMALFHCPFIHSSVMVKKEVLAANPYNDQYEGVEDFELWSRLLFRYSCVNLQDPLISIRVHNANYSSAHLLRNLELIREIQENIAGQLGLEFSTENSSLINKMNDSHPDSLSLEELKRIKELLKTIESGLQSKAGYSTESVRKVLSLVWWKASFRVSPKDLALFRLFLSRSDRTGIRNWVSLFRACILPEN